MPKPTRGETKIHLTTINKQCAWIWLIEKIEISFVAAVRPPHPFTFDIIFPSRPIGFLFSNWGIGVGSDHADVP